jgi:hypothetical protein
MFLHGAIPCEEQSYRESVELPWTASVVPALPTSVLIAFGKMVVPLGIRIED